MGKKIVSRGNVSLPFAHHNNTQSTVILGCFLSAGHELLIQILQLATLKACIKIHHHTLVIPLCLHPATTDKLVLDV